MIRKRLVWAEDGRVGFEDEKAGNILLDEWPEFRQHEEIENAIEAHKEEQRAEAEYAWVRYNEGI